MDPAADVQGLTLSYKGHVYLKNSEGACNARPPRLAVNKGWLTDIEMMTFCS